VGGLLAVLHSEGQGTRGEGRVLSHTGSPILEPAVVTQACCVPFFFICFVSRCSRIFFR
jgi:hypothetical protein